MIHDTQVLKSHRSKMGVIYMQPWNFSSLVLAIFGLLVPATCNRTSCHHVPKCMSCHKAIVVITGRAHCFHGCIYTHMYIYIHTHICICIYIYIHVCMCLCVGVCLSARIKETLDFHQNKHFIQYFLFDFKNTLWRDFHP